jgi:hypothetical protein
MAMLYWNSKIAQNEDEGEHDRNKHAVIVHFNYCLDSLDPLHDLYYQLEAALEQQEVGEYDGHEISYDLTDGSLYFYGPNAEYLFKAVQPILKSTYFLKGATVKMIFGPQEDGTKEIDITI